MKKTSLSEKTIRAILREVSSRRISPARAYERLKHLPYESMGFARIDHHRHLRKGLPEAVYAPGKSVEQIRRIIQGLVRANRPVLVTRLEAETYRQLKRSFPKLCYSKHGRVAFIRPAEKRAKRFPVAVLTAGTSDIPVAEEAAVTLELMGNEVFRIYDCGVAGLHRLLDVLEELERARVVICVAGMEGALASVVAGLVSKPVIAVPTSVGYGSHFKGLAPLLTMLNTCSQGVACVNIDNGFGAACFASLMG